MKKLNNDLLSTLSASTEVPKFKRDGVKTGIAHFGVGGFHRAHQAVYLQSLLNQNEAKEWGILGVGIMDSDIKMRDSLRSQDYLYSVLERGRNSEKLKIIGAIQDFILAVEGKEKLIERLTDSNIKIVSLTVTEKGYYINAATGNLDVNHPAVKADIESPQNPVTAIGYIVEALARRKAKNIKPFTVMSCDNLPSNGDTVKRITLQYAEAINTPIKDFIKDEVCFPNTMVDRITPVTTAQNISYLKEKFDLEDHWPVFPEDFSQWVIEDNFSDGRPAWEKVGAEIVNNVHDYELMKIRLLNGSHSALAYISYLMGYRDVDLAMADNNISQFLKLYMNNISKTLKPIPGVDFEAYKASLIDRFANPAIKDQIQRLAMDGSQKLPNGIIAPLKDAIAKGYDTNFIAIAIAGWIRYLTAKDENGEAIEINDPLAATLTELAVKSQQDASIFITGLPKIFGSEVIGAKSFIQQVSSALAGIYSMGTQKYVASQLTAMSRKVA